MENRSGDYGDPVLRIDESMSLGDSEGAAAPIDPRTEVSSITETRERMEGNGRSERWSRATTRSPVHRDERRRSRSRRSSTYQNSNRILSANRNGGPWQYGPFDWRCEVNVCRRLDSFPNFSGLEKHYQKMHSKRRIEYVCAFRGPSCYRSPKHDQAREHSRNALCHRRLSKAERIARTEHMPWIQAENPDYVPVRDTDVPPLPRNPEGGKILDPEPKPLPFAAKASPIVGIEAERRRCGMIKHIGEYVAVRPNPATHDTHKARPMPLPTGVRDGVFSSRDIRRGVVRSGSTPETTTRPTVETYVHRAHHESRPMLGRPSPQVLDAYRKEEICGELAQIRQEMDLLPAREALLRRRQEENWKVQQCAMLECLDPDLK